MAMTLDQARQAIITRAMAFTGIAQSRIKYPKKISQYQLMVFGVTLIFYGDSH